MNKVTSIPRGKYIDFRNPNIKSQNYLLWKLLQGKDNHWSRDVSLGMPDYRYAGEELGSLMNQAGTTGSIMNRISAGQAPGDINDAVWLALNKPKGTVLEEETGFLLNKIRNSNLGSSLKTALKMSPSFIKDLIGMPYKPIHKVARKIPGLKKILPWPKPTDPISQFKNAYNFSKTGRSFKSEIIDRPRPVPRTGGPVSTFDDWMPTQPIHHPGEAFGELAGLIGKIIKDKAVSPLSSKIISPIKNKYGNLKDLITKIKENRSKEKLSDLIYRYTPFGSISALNQIRKLSDKNILDSGLTIKNKIWEKSKSDIPKDLDPSLLDLFDTPTFHGGSLPDNIYNRLKPGEQASTGSIFNFDLFTTVDKMLAREYAVGKNAEAGGSLWQTIWNTPKSMSKVWDMRGGRKSLWSQNKKAYAALEDYFINVLGHTRKHARALLLGERVPGVAHVRGGRDRIESYVPMNLNEIFSTVGKNGPEWIIDTIAHAGGALQGGAQHSVLTTLDPEKNIKRMINLLPQEELRKTFSVYKDMLPSTLERFIEQYAKFGKAFGVLGQGTFGKSKPHLPPDGVIMKNGGYINPSYSANMSVPQFKDGINMVPADMLALIHKNEAVVPANLNPFNPNANNATMAPAVYNISMTNNAAEGMDINTYSDMTTRKVLAEIKRLDVQRASMNGMGRRV
jgi:hypothetical protein